MKKQLMSLMLALFLMAGTSFGQGQRMSLEERVNLTIEKLAPLALTEEQKTKTTVVITDFYTAQQKTMEEMRASGSTDREAFAAIRKELSDARDVKLKEIFTAEQMKKWVDEVEPSLRPQRRGN